ncbi:MAG: cyclopropane-fatty-acyl-phospholipid synthase family protein [Vicinamibacterales bacterium]
MPRVQVLALVTLLLVPASPVVPEVAAQQVIESNTARRDRDVIFVPTRTPVAEAMMNLANVTDKDVVYDLGCGDGALVIAAARRGARVVGVDIDPERIKEATEKVRVAGVGDRVTLIRGDIFDPAIKIGEASVVTLYLLQSLNEKLAPRLKSELKPGSRVVSHAFTMGESWPPEKTQTVESTAVYLWTIK